MHIWLRIIVIRLFSVHARRSSSTRISPLPLHSFLTFTDEKYIRDMSVMHRGKQNVSNALNSSNVFAVCHGGSIWSMIDIKGCLRIACTNYLDYVNLHCRLCNCFSPDWFVRLFQVRFWTLMTFRSPWCCDSSYSHVAVMSERTWETVSRGKNQSTYKRLVTYIGHSLNYKSVAHPLVIIYK